MSFEIAARLGEGWTIDHLFVFAEEAAAVPTMARLGFVESYRRRHPGQGTANVCYCFDNAYLELLWLIDAQEARSPRVAPTGLAERANWRVNGACPFGIALRPISAVEGDFPLPWWPYAAPFLPDGMSLAVAELSRDPAMPFVFKSPGGSPPIAWTDGRAGERQRSAGWHDIADVGLTVPESGPLPDDLGALAEAGLAEIVQGAEPSMTLELAGEGRRARLHLPELSLETGT